MTIYVHQKYELIRFRKTEENMDIRMNSAPHSDLIYDIESPYFGIKLKPKKYIFLSLTFKNNQSVHMPGPVPCVLCNNKIKDSCELVRSIIFTHKLEQNEFSKDSIKGIQQEYLCSICSTEINSALEKYVQQHSEDIVSELL